MVITVALTLALGVLSGAFLVLLGTVGVLIRIPVRAWLWTGLMMSWPAALAGADAGLLDNKEPYLVGTTGVCLFAAGLLTAGSIEKQRLQRQWRDTGGRMGTSPKVAIVAGWRVTRLSITNKERLDDHDRELAGLRALVDEHEEVRREYVPQHDAMWQSMPAHEAMVGIIRKAHEQEGAPLPDELLANAPTVPDRLKLVWDAGRKSKGA